MLISAYFSGYTTDIYIYIYIYICIVYFEIHITTNYSHILLYVRQVFKKYFKSDISLQGATTDIEEYLISKDYLKRSLDSLVKGDTGKPIQLLIIVTNLIYMLMPLGRHKSNTPCSLTKFNIVVLVKYPKSDTRFLQLSGRSLGG